MSVKVSNRHGVSALHFVIAAFVAAIVLFLVVTAVVPRNGGQPAEQGQVSASTDQNGNPPAANDQQNGAAPANLPVNQGAPSIARQAQEGADAERRDAAAAASRSAAIAAEAARDAQRAMDESAGEAPEQPSPQPPSDEDRYAPH